MTAAEIEVTERSSSPLELLFDLTYAVAVGVAADHLADLVEVGNVGDATMGFVFAMTAILVSWINYSWFASAFDTDDWFHRICTMIQMVGVIILALGLPATFSSIAEGTFVDIRLLVTGYVVMRVAMVALWLRTARREPSFRRVADRNVVALVAVQLAWIALAVAEIPLGPAIAVVVILGVAELIVPVVAQGGAAGTPWHPLHIADRYRAFAIITLGEGVIGTVASSGGILGGRETIDAQTAIVVVAGIGITFAVWWIYFSVPFGELLVGRPTRGYLFGYGHIPVFISIAAIGAGLRITGSALSGHTSISHAGVTATVALPVAIYLLAAGNLAVLLGRTMRWVRIVTPAITDAIALGAIGLAAAGLPLEWALIAVMLAAFITVAGWESSLRSVEALADSPRD
jgi:low temperature requirement protein LtrA